MTEDSHPSSSDIEEVDDEDIAPCAIDLRRVRLRKEYEEFWSDICWREICE